MLCKKHLNYYSDIFQSNLHGTTVGQEHEAVKGFSDKYWNQHTSEYGDMTIKKLPLSNFQGFTSSGRKQPKLWVSFFLLNFLILGFRQFWFSARCNRASCIVMGCPSHNQ